MTNSVNSALSGHEDSMAVLLSMSTWRSCIDLMSITSSTYEGVWPVFFFEVTETRMTPEVPLSTSSTSKSIVTRTCPSAGTVTWSPSSTCPSTLIVLRTEESIPEMVNTASSAPPSPVFATTKDRDEDPPGGRAYRIRVGSSPGSWKATDML